MLWLEKFIKQTREIDLLVLPIRLLLVRKGVHSDLLILHGPTADESKMSLDSFRKGKLETEFTASLIFRIGGSDFCGNLCCNSFSSFKRSATTSLTRPASKARCASIGSPVRFICIAKDFPTAAQSLRTTAPAMIPRFISGCPNIAFSPAMRISRSSQVRIRHLKRNRHSSHDRLGARHYSHL